MTAQTEQSFSALLAICAGNSPDTGEFPAQRPVTRSFDVLFDLRLNKRLSKQSPGWWFDTTSRPLWRHCIEVTCAFFSPNAHWWATQARSGPLYFAFIEFIKYLPTTIIAIILYTPTWAKILSSTSRSNPHPLTIFITNLSRMAISFAKPQNKYVLTWHFFKVSSKQRYHITCYQKRYNGIYPSTSIGVFLNFGTPQLWRPYVYLCWQEACNFNRSYQLLDALLISFIHLDITNWNAI